MTFGLDGNLVPIAGMVVPIVGSIALFSFLAVAVWSGTRQRERETYYKNETLKKIAESSGEGAKAAIELLREDRKPTQKRSIEGMKLGGLITSAVGIGLMALLHGLEHEEPVYLVGVIPLLIGLVLLAYAFLLAPKQSETLKEITEVSAEGAKAAIELLREQQKYVEKRRLEGLKLGGFVTIAVGIGIMVIMHGLYHNDPIYLAGLFPLFIGVATLAYTIFLAPKQKE